MKNSILLSFLILFFSFFISVTQAHAQRGCCSWHGGVSGCDGSVGRIVCNDGTYSPSCGCGLSNPPTSIPLPTPIPLNITANNSYTYNSTLKTYEVISNWEDVSNSDGYSVSVSSVAGTDPGPLIDTNLSQIKFGNVKPGKKYINLKSKQNGRWSSIVYWTITIPPYPTPKITQKLFNTRIPTKRVFNSPYPTQEPTIYIPSYVPPTIAIQPQSKYTCNCGKTCTQISTCDEAYFQLKDCGCGIRDGDGDGVPCENLCK